MLRRFAAVALLSILVLSPNAVFAQQAAQSAPAVTITQSADAIERIKDEGMNRSQVMKTLSYLTDVIGPRLTNSPNMKRANEWTRDEMTRWGLQNAHLEAWGPFGRGWSLKRFSAQVTEPQSIPLIAFPKAWSPGTNGSITGDVVYLNAKDEAELEQFKGKLKGAIVLTSGMREVKARFEAMGTRRDEKDLLSLADAPEPRGGQRRMFQMSPEQRTAMMFGAKKTQFLFDEGAAVMIDPSRIGDGGTIFVQSASVPQPFPSGPIGPNTRGISPYDKSAPKLTPQLVMAVEHYNRLVRMIEAGEKVKMSVDLAVEFHDADLMGYNTIAEIPGTDLKDEIVMLGGHMDSWHAGTGATDNGAGVAVGMEALRIIQALGLKPRRTIRIALWSGEEQGLLGSRAYVAEHFGKMEVPTAPAGAGNGNGGGTATPAAPVLVTKPDYEKLSAYFNLDNGTGKIRGVYLQGNEGVRPLFRQWLTAFRDRPEDKTSWGASTLSISNTGGTDHLAFDAIGLPGFQFIQDEIEYDTRTHHSNQDVFDRIQGDDMKQAATIMAAFVYNTAMLDQKLPRKPMPGK
jgi:carboxypeptidase Q